jgi:hypothetical protein
MKALSYISILALLVFSSCSSTLYTGADYDDLYYSASDAPVLNDRATARGPIEEKELRANDYYDNVYAGDTLIADRYSLPSDYDDQIVANNSVSGGSGYDYYNDSYADRLSMFYGNYFNPYWQDPFYFNFGYNFGYPYFGLGFNYGFPYFGLGFGFNFGYPYYYGYNPYYWDPFYYGGYWGYPYFGGGYYSYPYYSHYGYYGEGRGTSYGRRERPSNMSSRYNENMGTAGYRRGDGTYSGYSATGRRSAPGNQTAVTTDARRSATGTTTPTAVARSGQDVVKSDAGTPRSAASMQRSQVNTKPEYRNAERSYVPSYNNPRMSTRPSYNNSRVSDGSGTRINESRNFSNSAPVRSSQSRSLNQSSGNTVRSGSFNSIQRRYSTPSSSSRTYSAPSRRSYESGRSYSSGSSRSSSYSGGSSSGFSRSSYSSGSSSYSSGGGRSSSSSHSSGSRR